MSKYLCGLRVTIAILCILSAFWAGAARPWQTPEEILDRFYSSASPEELLMDPLILGGKKVVPLVLVKVKLPDMPFRRYAIEFLGNGEYPEAVPVLDAILKDEREIDYIRGDSLVALYRIDQTLGIETAKTFADRQDYLGRMSQDVLAKSLRLAIRRSYFDAVLGR